MKHKWIRAFLVGTALGVVAGFCLGLWLLAPLPEPKRGPVLESFDFQQLARRAGNAYWKVIDDGPPQQDGNWYYVGPWQGRSSAMTRQIVARTRMSEKERNDFANRFASVFREGVQAQGAQLNGGRSGIRVADNEEHLVQWSAHHYYLGGMRGVVNTVMVSEGERVTLVVILTEVRATAERWPLGDIPLFRRSSGFP